ncbi:GXWXG domain-containing protein [Rhizobium sp. 2MFCol3.1]|uniref:GXWXG domain-containing protein n=1 Tax=Rhizobium sp. 2MFCol3.1 TaxID=1246459 RepID=UPI0003711DCE|nr:GXWXG domain-containing protein [Rhizobium sp. 2MFCol3.1]
MSGGLQSEKIAWFASLPPVMPDELIGVWCGEGIPSGHPLDGVLENLQWFGKKFHPDFRADALLFQWRPRRLVPAEPSFFPIRTVIRFAAFGRTSVARQLFSHLSKLVRARDTTAFVTLRSFGEDQTAAMVYDRQPIADFFRRIGDDEIAGMMVVEGDQRRYFFRLRRVDAPDEKARP